MATRKQKAVIPRLVENGGNVSRAMREAGYSPATAKTPSKLTNSRGFQQLIKKYLPDNHVLQKHRQFLDAPRIVRTFKKGDLELEVTETDPSAVKALDLAYKIGGKYGDTSGGNKVLIINISGQSNERYGANASAS
jgi:hypothetical protein